MPFARTVLARLRAFWRRDAVTDEIREEMRFHLEQRAAEYEHRGLTLEQARREASRQFGNLPLQIERGYDVRGAGLIEQGEPVPVPALRASLP